MTVPLSGILTMEGLAQEALYGTYGTGTITSPIHMYDLVNGGNTAGSGNSYPAVNQDCTPNPATRGPSYQVFYAQLSGGDDPWQLYTLENPATDLATGDQIYSDTSGTTWNPTAGDFDMYCYGAEGDDCSMWFGCTSSGCPTMTVNSSGVITATSCGC